MGQPQMMHPGVSGAPHVSQPGAMMGMQPGAQMGHGGMGGQHPGGMMQAQMGGQSVPGGMPNAQAMNHMTPQQHMQQQQALAAQRKTPYVVVPGKQHRTCLSVALAPSRACERGIESSEGVVEHELTF